MCITKTATNASVPTQPRRDHSSRYPSSRRSKSSQTSMASSDSGVPIPSPNSSSGTHTSTSSSSSRASLTGLRRSLPENPHIYKVAEIRAATNNFLAKRLSPRSSASWRCQLRGKDVVVFHRKFRRKIAMDELTQRLSIICRSHHGSIVKLLGASVSGGGDHIYLVYEYVQGASLADCLRNSQNPSFTVLSKWASRIQVATDLAHGLDYIHNKTGLKIRNLVHNHIKSTSIMVTEPSFNAKICHFGTAQLCGETDELEDKDEKELKRSDSGAMRFEGVRGYMSAEYRTTGVATQKSDVYSFGIVMLELLSGEEPLKYRFDSATGEFVRTSLIDSAKTAVGDGDDGLEWRMRRWVDRRLGDSFPVEVVEKLTRLALDCVHEDPEQRPEMNRVAGKISKLYLESTKWTESVVPPSEISVSLNPR